MSCGAPTIKMKFFRVFPCLFMLIWRGLRGFNTDLTQFLQYYYQFSVFFRVNPYSKRNEKQTIPS